MAVLIWANAASRADLETGGFIAGLPWRAAFQIEFAGIYRFFSSLGKREAGGICVFLAMPAIVSCFPEISYSAALECSGAATVKASLRVTP
jgi:hypothetical protein